MIVPVTALTVSIGLAVPAWLDHSVSLGAGAGAVWLSALGTVWAERRSIEKSAGEPAAIEAYYSTGLVDAGSIEGGRLLVPEKGRA